MKPIEVMDSIVRDVENLKSSESVESLWLVLCLRYHEAFQLI
jgi:hypothetical protein